MSTVQPKCPLITPAVIILSYVAESDIVYAPDQKHAESRHRRIWQYFNTGDVFKARSKACRSILKENDRFSENKKDSADPDSPYLGMKLYFEYRLHEDRKGKKGKIYRFYLLDGEGVSQTELLERMEQESLFLIDSGNIFRRVEVTDDEGRLFTVAAEGLV